MNEQEPMDVLVVGSGAAGLVAALSARTGGARVQVIESGNRFGGTTALGGGRVWIPANGTPENAGDSPEAALTYLREIFDVRYPEMIESLVASAPEMRHFVEAHSPHRFVVCPNYPDYHQDLPGSTTGGRAFDVAPIATGRLVAESTRVLTAPGYLPVTHADWEHWRFPENYDTALIARRQAEGVLTGGPGLIAGLLDGVVRAGIRLSAETELVDLMVDEAGSVRGARVIHDGVEASIPARAIILATGGFDADDGLRRAHLTTALGASASARTDTGVALKLAVKYGYAVDNLSQGWWMPMMSMPGESLGDGVPYPRALIRERGVPHQIIVNSAGRRFLDESLPYNEFGKAVHFRASDGTYPNSEAYLIVDETFRERYSLPGLGKSGPPPSPYVTAASLPELAAQLGIDPLALDRTVARWNELCTTGHDDDFGRGDNAYDRYYGDPKISGNRNLGPVSRPPFHATRIFSATIGSKGGPVTTTHGQVLTADGRPVDGLYAVGNAAAFWTADGYPGPGATLAIGMTFGFRAGRAASARAYGRTVS